MLQANYNGPLGFSAEGATRTLTTAYRSGANQVGGSVIDNANAIGAGVIQAGKRLPAVVGVTAAGPCGLVTDPSIQQGATFASQAPSVYAQGVSKAAAASAGICNLTKSPPSSHMPIQTAGWNPTLSAMPSLPSAQLTARMIPGGTAVGPKTAPPPPSVMTAPGPSSIPSPGATVAALPPGSIQWQNSKTGRWTYAVPKAKPSLGVATIEALNGGLGAPGFVSPWLRPGKFTTPYGITPGHYKQSLWQRQYNWFDVNTSDSPYRTTWGIGETHTVVGTGTEPNPTAKTVTEKEGKSATTPTYKKWWFWAAIVVGTAVAGTGAYVVYKRRRG